MSEPILSVTFSEADLRSAWASTAGVSETDPDGETMPEEILTGMTQRHIVREIESRVVEAGSEVIETYLSMDLWRD